MFSVVIVPRRGFRMVRTRARGVADCVITPLIISVSSTSSFVPALVWRGPPTFCPAYILKKCTGRVLTLREFSQSTIWPKHIFLNRGELKKKKLGFLFLLCSSYLNQPIKLRKVAFSLSSRSIRYGLALRENELHFF